MLKSRGYEQEEIAKSTVKTDDKGAHLPGHGRERRLLRFNWSSRPPGSRNRARAMS